MIEIREATKAQASDIARLIMMAMTDDCCLHFCGVGHGLEDFLKMMTSLVEREDSQYSYRNTLVAMADNKVVGIAVSYDGGKSAMMVADYMNFARHLLRPPRNTSARIILAWTMRHRQVSSTLIR